VTEVLLVQILVMISYSIADETAFTEVKIQNLGRYDATIAFV